MATYQASHNEKRSQQLIEIMKKRSDIPSTPEKAMQFLLWEKYEEELGVKKVIHEEER